MQTTLLGIAIAFILALVAALVGPALIDWSRYRAEFEARSAQIIGLDFRINGRIDARLLPTPTVIVHDVEFGHNGSTVRARALRVEYALGSLMRGEWRIDDAWLEGPEFEIGLDAAGRLLWPFPSDGGFAPRDLSIRRLSISDGRATFVSAASGSRLTLDKLEFTGALRSMFGPVQGDGSFVAAGDRYPFRISMGRLTNSAQFNLNIGQADGPSRADINLSIWLEGREPRFEGNIAFARSVSNVPAGSLVNAPWHLTSRIKGDNSAVVFEQIELQHGSDDSAIKLRGGAKLTFGSQSRLDAVLSAPQLDLDRMLSLPQEVRTKPLAAINKLAGLFSGAPPLPIPVTLGLSVEGLTLAGGTIQRVRAELRTDGDVWHIDMLDLRAPGLTQVRLSGRFDLKSGAATFKGPAKIESGDPRALTAWLTNQVNLQGIVPGSFRVSGDLSLSSETIAIDQLNAEIDRMTVLGSLAYSWTRNDRPARLDATLTAAEIDLDRVHAVAKAIAGDVGFDWPQAGSLSLKIGRTLLGGMEVKQSDVKMQIGGNGLDIEQLTIADFRGIALAARGRIDTGAQSPRGAITFNLDANSLEGVTALTEKFAPQVADGLRHLAVHATPVALRGSLTLEPSSTGSTKIHTMANFKLDGHAGAVLVALQGNTGIANDAFKADDLATLSVAEVDISGRLDADDGETLTKLIGLERLIVADRQPGRLSIMAKGPLDGELAIDGRLAVGALDISATGTIRASQQTSPSAALEFKIVNAKLRSPRPSAPGRPAGTVPASMNFGFALADGTVRLHDASGTVADTTIGGWLTIDTQHQPIRFDGNLELGSVNLAALIGAAIGIPQTAPSESPDQLWPSAPFEQGMHAATGQVTVTATHVALTPKLSVRDFQGRLYVGETQLALQVIDASAAGGRIAGELVLLREDAGLVARSRIKLTDADAAELLPGEGKIFGRLALDIAAEGTGMSPLALIGALQGRGRITLMNGRLSRFNPAAFDIVIGAADRGMPIDAARVRDRVDSALASGDLAIRRAEAGISIEGGQARMLSNPVLGTPDVDLAVNGLVNLADGSIDARLTLSALRASVPMTISPEIVVALKGPIDTPVRTIDVSTFANWLALRAIEQQSKNLDKLQGREPAPGASSTKAPLPAVQQP
ncbi:MAG: AsmA family protein [Xanthobacteraceae bacterium]